MEELKKAIETASATVNAKREAVTTASANVNARQEAVNVAELAMFENPNKTTATAFKEAKTELATAEKELEHAKTELATAEKELEEAQNKLLNALPNACSSLFNVCRELPILTLLQALLSHERSNRGSAISLALVLQNPVKYSGSDAFKVLIADITAVMEEYAPNNGKAIKGNCADLNTLRGAVTLAGMLAGLEAVSTDTVTAKLTKE